MSDLPKQVEHLHYKVAGDTEDSYFKEVYLTGINQSVALKSNSRDITLDDMVNLGITALKKIQEVEK